MLSTRFGKSQDLISRTIFPILFDQFLPTQEGTFIDHLNYLEKVRVIDDAQWWFEIRDIRNSLTHEYFDDAGIIAGAVNKLLEETPKLIAFWEELKPKVEALLR
jgi:hypothetical protein